MPQTIIASGLTVTKLASSGNFLFVFQNAQGGIQFVFSVPSADMATFAALTSGNSSTKQYQQDMNKPDYPQHVVHGEGN